MKIPLSTRRAFGLQELLISSSVWSCLVLLVAIVFLDSHEGQVSHFASSKQCFLLACRFFFFSPKKYCQKKTENKAPCISFLAAKQWFMLTHGLMKSRKLQVCPQIRNRSACELSIRDFDMMHLPIMHFKPDKLFIHLPTARRSATASFSLHTRYEWRLSRGARVSASSSSLSYDSSEPLDQSWQQGYL